jgi:hypothetical protein
MDLLERYLQSVGQYLDHDTKDDVLAELRANLMADIDARSEHLGRSLSKGEVVAILRAHGRPSLVAARYLPQRYLIGPALFPVYVFTLRKAAPMVALIFLLASASLVILSGGTLAAAIGRSLLQLVPVLLLFWGIVTMTFGIMEFVQRESGESWQAWDPAELPPVEQPEKHKSPAGRIADVVVHCLWILYVLAIPHYPFLILGPGTFFLNKLYSAFAPVWHVFYFAYMIVLLTQLGIKLIALNPGSDRRRLPLKLLSKLLDLVPIGILAFAKVYIVPASSPANLHTFAVINYWMNVGFRIGLVIMLLSLVVDAWKYVRPKIPTQRLAF